MTHIIIWRSHEHNIIGFTSRGHAGYAGKGSDIICASVSTLVQAAILGLQDYLHLDLKLKIDRRRTKIRCFLKNTQESGPAAQAILETMALALNKLMIQYPEHVKIIDKLYRGGG